MKGRKEQTKGGRVKKKNVDVKTNNKNKEKKKKNSHEGGLDEELLLLKILEENHLKNTLEEVKMVEGSSTGNRNKRLFRIWAFMGVTFGRRTVDEMYLRKLVFANLQSRPPVKTLSSERLVFGKVAHFWLRN